MVMSHPFPAALFALLNDFRMVGTDIAIERNRCPKLVAIQNLHDAENADAVTIVAHCPDRNIGNFAAHPIKSTNSGEIVEVELGEAEWTLDVLEGLFDFYFVQPAQIQAKKEALNKKLAEAGKPPLK